MENYGDSLKKVEIILNHKNFDKLIQNLNNVDSIGQNTTLDEKYNKLMDKVDLIDEKVSKMEENMNLLQNVNEVERDSEIFSNTE